jgi:inorganic triphosphatase YgiF
MSSETELKFRIPAARLAAVRRAVATRTALVEPLAAVYFDTPGEHLARARVALRLRREGVQWVQTLKAEGASAMHRLEHNVPLGDLGDLGASGARGASGAPVASGDPDAAGDLAGASAGPVSGGRPAYDLARHAGTAAGAVLARVLADAGGAALVERYATDVQRTRRMLRHGGARIELALDEGRIEAGDASCGVCEIEFELLSGPPQALLALASRWVDRFGLVLDVRSKSERGHRLATGQSTSAPTRARPLTLSARAGLDPALAAMLGNALGQVLANASVLAAPGDVAAQPVAAAPPACHPVPDPELLHQLRVGLRRLRTVLKLFAAHLPPAVTGLAPALATLFAQLGAARDRDAMAEWLWPALQAAGAPPLHRPADTDTDTDTETDTVSHDALAALLATPAVQQLWLALLGATLPDGLAWPAGQDGRGGPDPTPAAMSTAHTTARTPPRLRTLLRKPLQQLLRQVRRDAAHFDRLDVAARHRLRRRIKRLRYAVELSASLWPAKRCSRFLRALQKAQTPLGEFNDSVVAQAHCQALAAQDPHAWFAVGWLSAHRQSLEPRCKAALARLAKAGGFW